MTVSVVHFTSTKAYLFGAIISSEKSLESTLWPHTAEPMRQPLSCTLRSSHLPLSYLGIYDAV